MASKDISDTKFCEAKEELSITSDNFTKLIEVDARLLACDQHIEKHSHALIQVGSTKDSKYGCVTFCTYMVNILGFNDTVKQHVIPSLMPASYTVPTKLQTIKNTKTTTGWQIDVNIPDLFPITIIISKQGHQLFVDYGINIGGSYKLFVEKIYDIRKNDDPVVIHYYQPLLDKN